MFLCRHVSAARMPGASKHAFVCVDRLQVHDVADNVVLVRDTVACQRSVEAVVMMMTSCTPPSMSRATRAMSSALPHELRLIIDTCCGMNCLQWNQTKSHPLTFVHAPELVARAPDL